MIRIFDTETKVEIAEPVAAQFALNMKRPGGDSIRVRAAVSGGPESIASEAPSKGSQPKRRKEKHDGQSKA